MLYAFFHKYVLFKLITIKRKRQTHKYLKECERSQYFDEPSLAELQLDRLKSILNHAYETVPYYREQWDLLGLKPESIKSLADIRKLPFLTKENIQKNREALRSSSFDISELTLNLTGGSTGQPLSFYVDQERWDTRLASTIRHDRWAGKDISTKFACIWGHPAEGKGKLGSLKESLRDRFLDRVLYLDTSSLDDNKIDDFLSSLNSFKPEVYVAYANSIYMLAKKIKAKGIKDYHRPKSIITSAELLTEDMREAIENVFGCKVFNRYGCREVSVIASECVAHDGLHVNAEYILVEVLKDGEPVKSGEVGEVVITDLMNRGMPLIRYKIKDTATVIDGDCSCGITLPRIKLEGGRTTDFLALPGGGFVSGAALTIHLVATVDGISQAQIVQDKIDSLVINVLKGDGFASDTEMVLISKAKHFVGDGVDISINYIDKKIEATASGKHRFSISNVDLFQDKI